MEQVGRAREDATVDADDRAGNGGWSFVNNVGWADGRCCSCSGYQQARRCDGL